MVDPAVPLAVEVEPRIRVVQKLHRWQGVTRKPSCKVRQAGVDGMGVHVDEAVVKGLRSGDDRSSGRRGVWGRSHDMALCIHNSRLCMHNVVGHTFWVIQLAACSKR